MKQVQIFSYAARQGASQMTRKVTIYISEENYKLLQEKQNEQSSDLGKRSISEIARKVLVGSLKEKINNAQD